VGRRHRGGDDEAGCGGGRGERGNELGFVTRRPRPAYIRPQPAVSRPWWAATASCSWTGLLVGWDVGLG
jgi:hypothetical protein